MSLPPSRAMTDALRDAPVLVRPGQPSIDVGAGRAAPVVRCLSWRSPYQAVELGGQRLWHRYGGASH